MKIFSLFKKSPNSLKPAFSRPRHRCPFYGLYYSKFGNIFIELEESLCAMAIDTYSPCQMEIKSQKPNWDKCPLNNEKNREKVKSIKDTWKFILDEFRPQKLSFDQWMEYVMGKGVERPR